MQAALNKLNTTKRALEAASAEFSKAKLAHAKPELDVVLSTCELALGKFENDRRASYGGLAGKLDTALARMQDVQTKVSLPLSLSLSLCLSLSLSRSRSRALSSSSFSSSSVCPQILTQDDSQNEARQHARG